MWGNAVAVGFNGKKESKVSNNKRPGNGMNIAKRFKSMKLRFERNVEELEAAGNLSLPAKLSVLNDNYGMLHLTGSLYRLIGVEDESIESVKTATDSAFNEWKELGKKIARLKASHSTKTK